MTKIIFIGGLVAAGFDNSGDYLLTVSHAGLGVYSTTNWERVARDSELAYPENGLAIGIGPIAGSLIRVIEVNDAGELSLTSPDGQFALMYKEGALRLSPANV